MMIKCETWRNKCKYCDCFLEYTNFKDDLIEYKCCNKNYQHKFDEKLKERFFNTYKLSNFLMVMKRCLSFRMYWWFGKINEASLPEKGENYSSLDPEDIIGVKHVQAQRGCEAFEIKKLEKYYDLYVQSETLLLADILKNFRNICLEMYELCLAKFLSSPRLAWQSNLKRLNKN